jgi:hypothetical protein
MQQESTVFAHRYTEDGKIESICLRCFLTVACSENEEEMVINEAEHICQLDVCPERSSFYNA